MNISQVAFFALLAITTGEFASLIISLYILDKMQLKASIAGLLINVFLLCSVFSIETKNSLNSIIRISRKKKGEIK